jgi:DNA-directed RNA polymerase specialized sigma24 family protein
MCQGRAPQVLLQEDQELEELTSAGLMSLEHTLTGTAQEDASHRTASHAADARIVDILRADNFQGPRYQKATTRLMEYGWLTINKWTGNGDIFAHARRAGRPVPAHMTTPDWDADDRAEVATDTVIAGLDLFLEHGLIRGKWNPAGGASLTTYFVGASIRSFRPVYIRWFRGVQTGQAELDLPASDDTASAERDIPDQRATDPFYAAATHDEIKRILPYITDTKVRKGLALRALGYTQQQAAEKVGLTEKALEGRIGRLRARILTDLTGTSDFEEGGAR